MYMPIHTHTHKYKGQVTQYRQDLEFIQVQDTSNTICPNILFPEDLRRNLVKGNII